MPPKIISTVIVLLTKCGQMNKLCDLVFVVIKVSKLNIL